MAKLKPNQFITNGYTITERPILFQKEMVGANMEDRKTQTRRSNGLKSINEFPNSWNRENNPIQKICRFFDGNKVKNPNPMHIFFGFKTDLSTEKENIIITKYIKCPYGKPGDLIWVREAFLKLIPDHIITSTYAYKADSIPDTEEIRKDYIKSGLKYQWKPSIHMPKSASRIWLMVEDISVERVQEISEEDAKAEGVRYIEADNLFQRGYFNYGSQDIDEPNPPSAKSSFESLWISINGEESWESNPWVWVIKYRILSKTGRPDNDIILENHLEITGKEGTNV